MSSGLELPEDRRERLLSIARGEPQEVQDIDPRAEPEGGRLGLTPEAREELLGIARGGADPAPAQQEPQAPGTLARLGRAVSEAPTGNPISPEGPIQALAQEMIRIADESTGPRRPVRPFLTEGGVIFLDPDTSEPISLNPAADRVALELAAELALSPLPAPPGAKTALARGFLRGLRGGIQAGASVAVGELADPSQNPAATIAVGALAGGTLDALFSSVGTALTRPVKTVEAERGRIAREVLEPGMTRSVPVGSATGERGAVVLQGVGSAGFLSRAVKRSLREGEQFGSALAHEFGAKLGQVMNPQDLGVVLQNTLFSERTGRLDLFRQFAERGFAQVDEMIGDVGIDAAPVLEAVRALEKELKVGLDELAPEAHRVLSAVTNRVQRNAPEPSGLVDMAGRPLVSDDSITMSFAEMQRVRSTLLRVGRTGNEILRGEAQGQALRLAGKIDRSMRKAAQEANPEAFALFREMNRFWKDGRRFFDNQVIKGAAEAAPEKVSQTLLDLSSPTRIADVKKAITTTPVLREGSVVFESDPRGERIWSTVQGSTVQRLVSDATDFSGGFRVPETLSEVIDFPVDMMTGFARRSPGIVRGETLESAIRKANSNGPALETILGKGATKNLEDIATAISVSQRSLGERPGAILVQFGQANMAYRFLSGDTSIAGEAATIVFGPVALGRLSTNRRFVDFMIDGFKAPAGSRAAARAFSQVAALLAAENSAQRPATDEPSRGGTVIDLPPPSEQILERLE